MDMDDAKERFDRLERKIDGLTEKIEIVSVALAEVKVKNSLIAGISAIAGAASSAVVTTVALIIKK